mgnify:CR=1 FL=1
MAWPNNGGERGYKLEELIMELNLEIINKAGNPPTFRSRFRGESYIDVTLTSRNMAAEIQDWKTLDGITTSDHNVVLLTIGRNNTSEPNLNTRNTDCINLQTTNWVKVERTVQMPEVTAGCNVDNIAMELASAIKISIASSQNSTRTKLRKPKCGFWHEGLARLRRIARAKRKSYQRSTSE